MFEIGQKVYIPRSRGGFTLAEIGRIDPPVSNDDTFHLFVFWTEKISLRGGRSEERRMTKWVPIGEVKSE
jgi:hypothetical protein